jgi:hypothetical protein
MADEDQLRSMMLGNFDVLGLPRCHRRGRGVPSTIHGTVDSFSFRIRCFSCPLTAEPSTPKTAQESEAGSQLVNLIFRTVRRSSLLQTRIRQILQGKDVVVMPDDDQAG